MHHLAAVDAEGRAAEVERGNLVVVLSPQVISYIRSSQAHPPNERTIAAKPQVVPAQM